MRQVEYSVVMDNEYAIWHAFANNYWPALYFTDRDGNLTGHHGDVQGRRSNWIPADPANHGGRRLVPL